MDVIAIMPCRGRAAQTVETVRRMLATAGTGERASLWCVGSDVPAVVTGALCLEVPGLTYWEALAYATDRADAPLIATLANDLLPGRDWLARGVAAYRARFGEGDGLMGFNDGLHGPEHSPHFLISRGLLDRFGGWPTHYRHNFGDTELCQRAQQAGCYGKAPWAVLYHNHLESGAADDAVYAAGRATYAQDAGLFEQRRRRGWTL